MTVRFPNSPIFYCISLHFYWTAAFFYNSALFWYESRSDPYLGPLSANRKKKEHAYAVEPPVTSPLYNGHSFGPGRQSIHWLLYNPLYNGHLKGNGHYCFNKSVSPTAKLTSQQRPVFSAANEQVNNGHSEICFVRRVDDLSWQSYLDCVIYSAAVSMNCLRHLQRMLLTLFVLYR